MTDDDSQPAIVLVQWGKIDEPNEIDEIRGYFDTCDMSPDDLPGERINSSNIQDLWAALERQVKDQSNLQILYFSAHGDEEGNFGFSTVGPQRIPYKLLMEKFGECLEVDSVHLVLGACHAMSAFEQWASYVPTKIRQVTGFWPTVDFSNVAALMAGVVQNDQRLLHSLSAYVGENIQDMDPAELQKLFDQHSEPLQNVLGKGQIVLSFTRMPDGSWKKKAMVVKQTT